MHVVGIEFAMVAAALFVGSVLQGSLGFGMVLVAFPALVFADPELLPQTTVIAGLPMVFMVAWQHRGGAALRDVGLITLGRLPGFALAVAVLAVADSRAIGLLAGVTVLAGVAVSLGAAAVPRTTPNLLTGGALSALFGTATAIGGPPIALLFQHDTGPKLRSTMSSIVAIGAPASFLVLVLTGNISALDTRTGIALAPFSIAGAYTARWTISHVDDRLRPIILGVCAFGAVVAMARLLVGT